MKTREELIKEAILLEHSALLYKRGLKIAKKAIEEMMSGSALAVPAYKAFDEFISENRLQEL